MDRFPIVKKDKDFKNKTARALLIFIVSRKTDTADYVETDVGECYYFTRRSPLYELKEHQE